MKITVIKRYGIESEKLPQEVYGSFWLDYKDANWKDKKLINVSAENGNWKISSDIDTKIYQNNQVVESAYLKEYNYYFLKTTGEEGYITLYCTHDFQPSVSVVRVLDNSTINVGSSPDNNIFINNPLVKTYFFKLEYQNKEWLVNGLDTSSILYVNNEPIGSNKLQYGDILFIMGTKIIVMKDFVIIDSSAGNVQVKGNMFSLIKEETLPESDTEEQISGELELYTQEDYFFSSPRLKPGIERPKISIESPPASESKEKGSLLLTLGPMLTMALVTIMTGYTALSNVFSGKSTLKEAMPSLVVTGAMLLSAIFWPLVSKRVDAGQRARRERNRQKRYKKYLEEKRKTIEDLMKAQSQALHESFPNFEECKNIIEKRKMRIWERKVNHEDFLELRLGLGTMPIMADIDVPTKQFSLSDDNLRKMLDEMISATSNLVNVPVTVKLNQKNITAIVGEEKLTRSMLNSLILQMMTFHSYEILKLVIITDKKHKKSWEFLRKSPHLWDDDKNIRFFGSNNDDLRELSAYLDAQFNARRYKETNNGFSSNDLDYKSYRPYYVIITDNFKSVKDLECIKSILKSDVNVGFSLIILSDKLANIPNECNFFIYTDKNMCGMFEDEMIINRQKTFVGEFPEDSKLEDSCVKLLNIPIEFQEQEGQLPASLGFLEMYQVGKVEQLNSLNRWKTNNPTQNLQTPIGVNKAGDLFKIDLHEKFHGPHGLIAGGTGSGKSEFIITFILSMAVNYHPNEVSFVLIDYKGGGLAGVFENRETNVRLPHLAGTITNLDVIEMNRALASIQSELKKRQKAFNEARDSLGESSVDIYKYQRLYREGKVSKPLSHLFIISDEFAELKSQQPEFMDQLISTARIGRSLGVHLILATQKPSGVVDDQIWSNSKFRVCLKVQESADSIDMIKVPDAADIKNVGRFYLQVGYNEFFDLGQSAWCGGKYTPMDKPEKKVDNSLSFVDSVGRVIGTADDKKKKDTGTGEEVGNILKYLIEIAEKENVKVDKLWLDAIPGEIFVSDLKEKYSHTVKKREINPVIGECDDPSNQRQGVVNLSLSKDGNTIIYGMAGAGKENLLTTIIYSSIIDHNADEVSFYILDFGSESMKMFKDAPQVGDVVFAHEKEKVANLFKMLGQEIETRKKLFADYNGDIDLYCKNTKKDIPLIVAIINGYSNFLENYEDYEERLVSLTREGGKYGIIVILVTSGATTVRYRLSQNFKEHLVLQFTDPTDYNSILGKTDGVQPSRLPGRGLIKMDKIYEFQTALPYKLDSLTDYIKIICEKLKEDAKEFAKPIPILPDDVTAELVKEKTSNLNSVPVGMSKNNLEIETYDFKNNYASIITASDLLTMRPFTEEFIKVLKGTDVNFIVIDAEKILNNMKFEGFAYYSSNFSSLATELLDKVSQNVEALEQNNGNKDIFNKQKHTTVIIIGIAKFIKSIENDVSVEEFLTKGKDWGNFSLIFIDSVDNFKTYEYESWYKTILDPSTGIWIGEGASDQYTLKITKNTRMVQEEISNNFGYIIQRGNPTLIKVLDPDGVENE